MSTPPLQDIISGDDAFMHQASEFGTSTQLEALKAPGGAQALVVIFGDMQSPIEYDEDRGRWVNAKVCSCTVVRSQFRAATVAAGLTEREPVRGDKIIVAGGAYSGTWYVQNFKDDLGDFYELGLADRKDWSLQPLGGA